MEVKNYLLGYKNLYIFQDSDMFNFSLDSVLLPNFVTMNKGIKKILDIGTGNAPIPLILSTKTSVSITGVEIQPDVYNLAIKSVKINELDDQIDIINGDINDLYLTMDSDSYDIITCNPPFFKIDEASNLNNCDYKTFARHEIKLNLSQLFKISKKLLKNNGVIGIVHRPDRLCDIIEAMRANNIEPKKIRFVYPKMGKPANMLLIEGKKNGNPGLKVLEPLYVHNDDGNYSSEVLKYFE